MGIILSVLRVVEKTIERTYYDEAVPYYRTEDQEWFDHLRYSGDRKFVMDNDFYAIDHDSSLYRPVDIPKTIEWVKDNIYEGNQPRLINALERMQDDESLCFHWSF